MKKEKAAPPPIFEILAELAISNEENRKRAIRVLENAKRRLKDVHLESFMLDAKTKVSFRKEVTNPEKLKELFNLIPK